LGDTHDLYTGAGTVDGKAIITRCHPSESPEAWLTGSDFEIRIVLIGEHEHQVVLKTETNLKVTLNPAKLLPKVELIKHSLLN